MIVIVILINIRINSIVLNTMIIIGITMINITIINIPLLLLLLVLHLRPTTATATATATATSTTTTTTTTTTTATCAHTKKVSAIKCRRSGRSSHLRRTGRAPRQTLCLCREPSLCPSLALGACTAPRALPATSRTLRLRALQDAATGLTNAGDRMCRMSGPQSISSIVETRLSKTI